MNNIKEYSIIIPREAVEQAIIEFVEQPGYSYSSPVFVYHDGGALKEVIIEVTKESE